MRKHQTLVIATLVLAACAERPREPLGVQRPFLASTVAQLSQEVTPDQMEVAQVVPGFGGYFIDETGEPTVYLADPSQQDAAAQALAGFLADRGFTAADLRVRQADYSYLQLDAWHEQAWPAALAVSGAVFSDVDEASNRLRFGGVDAAAVAGIAAAVVQQGVPSAAVVVEQTAPIAQALTLRDRVRPVHGGYQINFFASPVSPVTLVCTLGFNAVKNGVNSFIVNSHCTDHQGGTETPTDYYQPLRDQNGDRLPDAENFIGVEVEDPQYDPITCATDFLPGTVCRYSDAARAEYAAGLPFDLGRIARTEARDPDNGTLTVDAANPSFRIVAEARRSVVGEEASKVGRTTGWTFGPVTQTCINSLVLGTVPPIIQRCQDRVRAGVAGGDSGSPVFRRLGNGSNVRLMGILWGSSVGGDEVTFVFSPMHGIHRELGDFQTH